MLDVPGYDYNIYQNDLENEKEPKQLVPVFAHQETYNLPDTRLKKFWLFEKTLLSPVLQSVEDAHPSPSWKWLGIYQKTRLTEVINDIFKKLHIQ